MPRMKRYSEHLLKEIDSAIPNHLRDDQAWSVGVGTVVIREESVETLLVAISEETGVDEVGLAIYDDDAEIQIFLWIEPSGSSLEYECPDERERELLGLAHTIKNVFQENARWTSKLPKPVAFPRRLLRSPKFAIGYHPPSIWRQLSWHRIAENVISNWLSHILIGATTFGVGFALGASLF
ncbi:MAG: hypothetical protein ACE5JL_08840 [Dehalococcoidia bacterium]